MVRWLSNNFGPGIKASRERVREMYTSKEREGEREKKRARQSNENSTDNELLFMMILFIRNPFGWGGGVNLTIFFSPFYLLQFYLCALNHASYIKIVNIIIFFTPKHPCRNRMKKYGIVNAIFKMFCLSRNWLWTRDQTVYSESRFPNIVQ